MKFYRTTRVFLLFAFISVISYAQFQQPSAVVKLNESAKELLLNDVTGYIVVLTGKSYSGIDTSTNKKVWEKEFSAFSFMSQVLTNGGISLDMFSSEKTKVLSNVQDTPYMNIDLGGAFLVINTFNGELVFDSGKVNGTVENIGFLPEKLAFLIDTEHNQQLYVSLYSLEDQKIAWSTKIGEKSSFLKWLFDAQANRSKVDGEFGYIPRGNSIYKINLSSGEIVWKSDSERKISEFLITEGGKNIITLEKGKGLGGALGTKQNLNVLDPQTGKFNWDKSITTKSVAFIQDLGDEFIFAHYNGFNKYNYKTGEKAWKKDPRGKRFSDVILLEEGYLYTAGNEMLLIDENGEKKWKKFIEISDNKEDNVFVLQKIKGDKVMYVTSTYANLVDIKTGKRIWKKNLKFNEKRPTQVAYDEATDKFIVYHDEEFFALTSALTERPDPLTELKIKKEKDINNLEIRDKGYYLSGLGEVAYVDKAGKVLYQKFYKEPGGFGRGLAKVGLGVAAVGADIVANTTLETVSTDRNGNTVRTSSPAFGSNERAIAGDVLGFADAELAVIKRRFDATRNSENFGFFFSREKDQQEENAKVLVKLEKDTGKEVSKYQFSNNRPEYTIDGLTGTVYYLYKNEIQVFE
ncbi:PQQ-binding-like beta-propeller repeat protein [Aquimarina spongiae]|uniref:PQQ-like domain-containing protein n=1 Tax=Aquimarina spongiae TaxID=570521 RepID=A0A1M6KJT5_9FLAO|nr:PQQ-binding-like beta-propeller repeat protein [Aquimarina spongiae]SHJ59218.1 PQQ-like domain-containing protein [Aquimarina spongiae]